MIFALIIKDEESAVVFKAMFDSKTEKKAKKRVLQFSKALSAKYKTVFDIDIYKAGAFLNQPLFEQQNAWKSQYPHLSGCFIKQKV